MATRTIYLPPQFAIDILVADNPVQQLRHPSYEGEAEVRPHSADGVRGERVALLMGAVIVASHAIAGAQGNERVLQLPGGRAPAGLADFHSRGRRARWISPALEDVVPDDHEVWRRRRQAVRESWDAQFVFKEERREGDQTAETGLRPPQIGAVYGVLSHWKVAQEPGTVVMPTGTGKTETMLALLVKERPECLLVVVPNRALREQIAGKFLSLGVLQRFGVVGPSAQLPIVGTLRHIPRNPDEVADLFSRCNVVVTTMNVAGRADEDVQQAMADACSHLFIDEAHHISAATWERFRRVFLEAGKPIIQFTATPFRTDRRHVDGRVVFNYPLRKAQEEGYFKRINLIAIEEWDPEREDEVIARAAADQLSRDLARDLDHLVMARAESVERAERVLAVYRSVAPEHHALLIHSDLPAAEQRRALERLRAREGRIIVCVGMLGEGFDLPELKIAALHDPHKSLAITLQFTGRFTRARDDLGEATVVANVADPKVNTALRELYSEDADWNVLLRELSTGATARQVALSKFLSGFAASPGVPIQNVFPKMSTVVYRMAREHWDPDGVRRVFSDDRLYGEPAPNASAKVLLFVVRDTSPIGWGAVRDLLDVVHHLYVLYWDVDQQLLFINSSNNESLHEDLAKAVVGDDAELISDEIVFRSMHGIHQLILMNIGLSHSLGGAVRFSMHMGPDVVEGLADALYRGKTKTNLFGRGYEEGERTSVGCSKKGRIWSHLIASDVPAWVDWCRKIGGKLLDDSISIETILSFVIVPKAVTDRPAQPPISIEWPEEFYMRSEDTVVLNVAGHEVPFYEVGIELSSHDEAGPIRFRVFTEERSVDYEMRFLNSGVAYVPMGNAGVEVVVGRRSGTLAQWFQGDPPPVRFGDNSFLLKNVLYQPKFAEQPAFDQTRIEAWDWSGVDIKKESQTRAKSKEKRTDSIQYHVIQRLLDPEHLPGYDLIIDDDGSGEAADIVAIAATDERLVVHLYHCKFSKSASASARVDDLYAVCGQAQRSVHWRGMVERLFGHLQRRQLGQEKRGGLTRIEKGDLQQLRILARRAPRLRPEFRIFIVQPGLSKAKAGMDELELLGATELHLQETYRIPLTVVGSA